MNSVFKEIGNFKFWCQKVLPLVYDDSLSYYEVLCKFANVLNDIIENIDKIPDFIRELVSDEKLKEIMSELFNNLQEQIASANEGESKTATEPRKYGELVWINGFLYRIIHDMIAGDQYFTGSNCEKVTIEELIKNVYHPDTETIVLNGVVVSDNALARCDYHEYDASAKQIKIIGCEKGE